MFKKKNQKGFTLVELVVVIAIIGILAAIAVPKFSEATQSAEGAKVIANLRTIDSVATMALASGIPIAAVADITATATSGTFHEKVRNNLSNLTGLVFASDVKITTKNRTGFTITSGSKYGINAEGRAILTVGSTPYFADTL